MAPPSRRAAIGLLLGFLAYASWGLLSPVGKRLLDDFAPLGLNAVRFAIATLVFLAAVGPRQARASLRLLARRDVLWVNLLANASLSLFLWSLVRLEPTYATLGFYSAPLWTAALAALSLRERLGPWFPPAVAGLLLGGWLALVGPGPVPSAGMDAAGLALAVASAVLWAIYTVALRRVAPTLPLTPLMGASFLFGTLYFAALALPIEGPPSLTGHGAATWGWMALYVAVPTLASFILFNAAVQRAPAGLVNILVAAELAFTALFAWLLFGDRFGPVQLAGLALAMLSVAGYLAWQARRGGSLPLPTAGGPAGPSGRPPS